MRTIIGALLMCGICLAGCSAQSAAPPTPSRATTTATTDNPVTPAIYLKLMHELPYFASSSDASLIRLGEATCEVIPEDNGWLISVKNFTDHGIPAEQAGSAIQYAVSTYCPDEQVNLPN